MLTENLAALGCGSRRGRFSSYRLDCEGADRSENRPCWTVGENGRDVRKHLRDKEVACHAHRTSLGREAAAFALGKTLKAARLAVWQRNLHHRENKNSFHATGSSPLGYGRGGRSVC